MPIFLISKHPYTISKYRNIQNYYSWDYERSILLYVKPVSKVNYSSKCVISHRYYKIIIGFYYDKKIRKKWID